MARYIARPRGRPTAASTYVRCARIQTSKRWQLAVRDRLSSLLCSHACVCLTGCAFLLMASLSWLTSLDEGLSQSSMVQHDKSTASPRRHSNGRPGHRKLVTPDTYGHVDRSPHSARSLHCAGLVDAFDMATTILSFLRRSAMIQGHPRPTPERAQQAARHGVTANVSGLTGAAAD